MITHDTFLELAAIAIDFPLGRSEQERLDRHLAECASCARASLALAHDAVALASTPVPVLPERRQAEILGAVLRPPGVIRPLALIAAAALLGLLLVGSLLVGSGLLRNDNRDQLREQVVVPTATVETPVAETPAADTPVAETPVADAPTSSPAPSTAAPLGDTWADADVPLIAGRPVGVITAVTAGGPGFVAVGMGCTGNEPQCEGVIWTSADGRSWSRAPVQDATDVGSTLSTSGPSVGMVDVAAGDPGIVAIGYAARPMLLPTVWFSADGQTWIRTTLADTLDRRVNAVTWDGHQFVVVGEDRDPWSTAADLRTAQARAAVWTSPDGRTWSVVVDDAALAAGGLVDTMEDPTSGGMAAVVAGSGGLVAVGRTCTFSPAGCSAAAWVSIDGRAWSRAEVPSVAGGLSSVVAFSPGFLATGVDAGDGSSSSGQNAALLLASPDGRVWSRMSFSQEGDLGGLAVLGDRVFAVAAGGPVTLWVSDDGQSWIAAPAEGGPSLTEPGIDATAWRFAGSSSIAVWIGTASETEQPSAWYTTTEAQ